MVDTNNSDSNNKTDLKSLITKVDNRVKTKDVTETKGHNFEEHQLKIDLQKGIYLIKAFNSNADYITKKLYDTINLCYNTTD